VLFKYCGKSGICAETRDTARARRAKMTVANLCMIGQNGTLIACECRTINRNVEVNFCCVCGGCRKPWNADGCFIWFSSEMCQEHSRRGVMQLPFARLGVTVCRYLKLYPSMRPKCSASSIFGSATQFAPRTIKLHDNFSSP